MRKIEEPLIFRDRALVIEQMLEVDLGDPFLGFQPSSGVSPVEHEMPVKSEGIRKFFCLVIADSGRLSRGRSARSLDTHLSTTFR